MNVWADELDALLPRNFLETIPFVQLAHLPRYLKALATRMERAKLNPAKDKERGQQLAPYLAALRQLEANPPKTAAASSGSRNFAGWWKNSKSPCSRRNWARRFRFRRNGWTSNCNGWQRPLRVKIRRLKIVLSCLKQDDPGRPRFHQLIFFQTEIPAPIFRARPIPA